MSEEEDWSWSIITSGLGPLLKALIKGRCLSALARTVSDNTRQQKRRHPRVNSLTTAQVKALSEYLDFY